MDSLSWHSIQADVALLEYRLVENMGRGAFWKRVTSSSGFPWMVLELDWTCYKFLFDSPLFPQFVGSARVAQLVTNQNCRLHQISRIQRNIFGAFSRDSVAAAKKRPRMQLRETWKVTRPSAPLHCFELLCRLIGVDWLYTRKVHKYGRSTSGENWDNIVEEGTYYQ